MGGPSVLLDAAALRHNYRRLREAAGAPLFPLLKSEAYGHGAAGVAEMLLLEDPTIPYFCVARAREARELRARGLETPLLVLSEYSAADFEGGWPMNSIPVVGSLIDVATLEAAYASRRVLPEICHIELDTGMHRTGLDPADAPGAIERVRKLGLKVDGVMTHLARGEDAPEILSVRQVAVFDAFLDTWSDAWGEFPRWVHVCNSGGIARRLKARASLSAARPGIQLWGEDEIPGTGLGLRPVASVRAPIRRLFSLPKGEGLGYGHRFQASRPSLIGTVALGYADGVDRSLSRADGDNWQVGFVIDGVRVPIAGTVSMDLTMVDLSNHPKRADWEAELAACRVPALMATWIGDGQSAGEIARTLGTIAYEVLCAMGSRLPRLWREGT